MLNSSAYKIMADLMISMYQYWVKSIENVDQLLQIGLLISIWQPSGWMSMAQMVVDWHWDEVYEVEMDLMTRDNRDTPRYADVYDSYW